ncbi:LysR family transcriptional regulator [Pontibacillus halophilus]|nr:LysR family transcriptional regulator [Pontibacillus halophilus]
MDFEWYRSFISIYRHASVSEAAKARIMTQPAMSQHLSALEAEVGELLFTRTSRKLVPTEKGKELYTQLAPLIESLEEKTIGFKAFSTPASPVIRIGTALEFFEEHLIQHLEGFQARVITTFGTASELLNLLKEDKVDIIITSKKYQTPGVEHKFLMDEHFVTVAHRNLDVPTFSTKHALESWLSDQCWLSYGLELPIIRRFWREHFKKRPTLSPTHVLPNLHTILNSIKNGHGMSLLPTFIVDKHRQDSSLQVLFEELSVSNEIYLAYKSKFESSPEMNDTIKKLERFCLPAQKE